MPITLRYANLSARQILRGVVCDENIELPTHFETVGHILHFNLNAALLRFKFVIGDVFLDKTGSARTVINKTGSISNKIRVFPFEVIAGEALCEAEVRENGASLSVDLSVAYWNSRLGTEHGRLCDAVADAEARCVCDFMAGVGPFAVPIAKNGVVVEANDLNPNAVRLLRRNAQRNGVAKYIRCNEGDARQFWRALCREKADVEERNAKLLSNSKERRVFIDVVVMNLPAIALQFLDVQIETDIEIVRVARRREKRSAMHSERSSVLYSDSARASQSDSSSVLLTFA